MTVPYGRLYENPVSFTMLKLTVMEINLKVYEMSQQLIRDVENSMQIVYTHDGQILYYYSQKYNAFSLVDRVILANQV